MKLDALLLHPQSLIQVTRFIANPSHAVLLTGTAGIGTTSLAKIIAAQLLGTSSSEALKNQQYYRLITPKNNAIPIETIRELQNFFRLSVPGRAITKRVVVIDSADALSAEAQNALLKLLEEPPEGSVLILVSVKPDKLLATVRSRLQDLALLTPIKNAVLAHYASLGHAIEVISRSYLMSNGSLARMDSLLNEVDSTSSTFEKVKQILTAEPFERLLRVDELAKDKEIANEFVNALAQLASASTERAATNNPSALVNWHKILLAADTAQSALGKNGNTKLVLTDLMLTL